MNFLSVAVVASDVRGSISGSRRIERRAAVPVVAVVKRTDLKGAIPVVAADRVRRALGGTAEVDGKRNAHSNNFFFIVLVRSFWGE